MNQPSPSPIIQFHPFYCYTKVTPTRPRTVHPTMLADGPAQQINRTIVDRLTSSSKTKIKISKASQSAVNDRTRVFSHRTRRRTDERVCHGSCRTNQRERHNDRTRGLSHRTRRTRLSRLVSEIRPRRTNQREGHNRPTIRQPTNTQQPPSTCNPLASQRFRQTLAKAYARASLFCLQRVC